jgi:outer membrane receptor for ferrienterochelin and colicin
LQLCNHSAQGHGGGGSSSVALRDLGQARTLILIDGQRLIPVFGVTQTIPDLNSVPIGMVERIEVLRDGASSIYGAEAIAGVVNIIRPLPALVRHGPGTAESAVPGRDTVRPAG